MELTGCRTIQWSGLKNEGEKGFIWPFCCRQWRWIHLTCRTLSMEEMGMGIPCNPYSWWGKGHTRHIHTAGSEKGYSCTSILHAGVGRNTPCTFKLQVVERDTFCRFILTVLCWKIRSIGQNARKKVSPSSAFLPSVNCFSPASAFWHQGRSGTTGHELFQQIR